MLEPPPTATKPSKPPSVAKRIASLNEPSVGSTRAWSYTTASMPAARSDSSATATGSSCATPGSVTSITRVAPSARRSLPTSRVAPGPYLMLEASIVNTASLAIVPMLRRLPWRGSMDVVFRGATVYAGSGALGQPLVVAVRDERIVALCELGRLSASQLIDATDLAIAPGFINMHSHADHTLPAFPAAPNSISQGVTTEVVGLCGFSPAPVSAEPSRAEQLRGLARGVGPDLDWRWSDFASFLDRFDAARPSTNVAPLVGHAALRIAAMGMEARAPSETELAVMRAELRAALEAGAWGMSTGLVYAPGAFAELRELYSLGEELRLADAMYVSHIRNEGEGLFEAVDEALTIGQQHGIRSQVSHLKASGWHNVLLTSVATASRRSAEGRRVADLAAAERVDPLDYVLDLLIADHGATVMVIFLMAEEDVRDALSAPFAAIGSDLLGVTSASARVHPRAYGTFVRVPGWGVREAQLFPLEEAVRKMTGLPASILGLRDRGLVSVGAIADLV